MASSTHSVKTSDEEDVFNTSPCHRCQSQKLTSTSVRCSVGECERYFCKDCFTGRYKADLKEVDPTWVCFVCRDLCRCHM